MSDIIKQAVAPATQTDQSDEVRKELATRFQLLPEELQNVITSSDYQMKLFELAKKYKMTYEKLGTLELETTLVLLGMTHPKDFASEVKDLLKIKDEDFTNLMSDMQVQIFDPIKSALHGIYDDEENNDSEEQPLEDIKSSDKVIMEKAGITMSGSPLKNTTPDDSSSKTLMQSDLLKSIENPAKSTPTVLNPVTQQKPIQTEVVKPINQNESMQDSINKLLGNKQPASTNTENKILDKTTLSDTYKEPLPDLPPLAPQDGTANKPISIPKPVDTIILKKEPVIASTVDTATTPIQQKSAGDPYRENL